MACFSGSFWRGALLLATVAAFPGLVLGGDDLSVMPTEAVGIDQPVFDARMAALKNAVTEGDIKELHSLLVYKSGVLLYEGYFNGNDDHIDFKHGVSRVSKPPVSWHRDRPHYVASVTKTVTALLTGLALQALDLPVDTPVLTLLPGKMRPDASALTLKHLLTMRSGFVWDEWTSNDLKEMWQVDDFAGFLLARENSGPGDRWTYNSAAPNLILSLLEAQLAQPFGDWARVQFFGPMGITNYKWDNQPTGTPEGAARLFLRPQDMMKIGILLLDEGHFNGQQIVAKSWVSEMTQVHSHTANGDYGYFIWLRDLDGKAYLSADGDGGQYINVFPKEQLVIVMTQGNYLEWPLYADQAKRIMSDYIFPALNTD